MAFDLLSEPIKKYIYSKRWDALRPIQVAAITKILTTEENYILASRTASGKTEAAFFPILSKVKFNEPGVKLLYISPLIALINDQFLRIEELCKYLDIRITKWHGEANRTLKEKLVKEPSGIVLITPESLEAMFVNAPYNVKELFSNMEYVVIDEIHSFLGTDRGVQLQSILYRLQTINETKFRIIGLSATIGDYEAAKKYTGEEINTKILLDRTAKEVKVLFKYFGAEEKSELPLDLLKDLYIETKGNKVLIFPNSRGKAEEVAVKLKKIAERLNGHSNYFSHHSSVDKELRESIEHFAKNNQRHNFCIACTSTLELGIDIGTVDEVVQIDATYSISSLIQRVGRSGRRNGESSNLFLYATNPWSFLQSLACWLLFKEGFIEPINPSVKPFDILLHQILSIVKEVSGCDIDHLLKKIDSNFAFIGISLNEKVEIINYLVEKDILERIQNELIIGIEGERIVNSKDFYSVFKSEPNFKVSNAGKAIGEIPFSPQIRVSENILLAAKIWKIKDVDFTTHKIEVIPAVDGKKPLFFGGGGIVHPRVREKMLEILFGDEAYSELNEISEEQLIKLRKEFVGYSIQNLSLDKPIKLKEDSVVFYSFAGTKVNRTLNFLINKTNTEVTYNESSSSFELQIKISELENLISQIKSIYEDVDFHIENEVRINDSLLDFSKWGIYLPLNYKCQLVKDKFFDFNNTGILLNNLNLVIKS
jgi:ATP-dependent Lhr-like helicase